MSNFGGFLNAPLQNRRPPSSSTSRYSILHSYYSTSTKQWCGNVSAVNWSSVSGGPWQQRGGFNLPGLSWQENLYEASHQLRQSLNYLSKMFLRGGKPGPASDWQSDSVQGRNGSTEQQDTASSEGGK
ncbi:hypothetical protein ATANTOWER_012204 [Ataeniobius toweri]|uniref:Uncharacterized protein n=1 Tax=Ataeniobius toweri TaxID=208326 RepID=A0ABU7C901_9TELE|nr:hypothetical protein [Ataeniobius toweri]